MVLLIMLLYKQGRKENGALLTLSLREQNKIKQGMWQDKTEQN